MNHLAHFYLAGEDDGLNIGNYIADHVRGKRNKAAFSKRIQEGIKMHQAIDRYTDAHELTRESVDLLQPIVGRYSSVAIDVIYDHFLSKYWSDYSNENLQSFVDRKYQLLKDNYPMLPSKSQRFYQYMIQHNILYNYQHIDKLEMVFWGMSQRTRFESKLDSSVEALLANYDPLKEKFDLFFRDLRQAFEQWVPPPLETPSE